MTGAVQVTVRGDVDEATTDAVWLLYDAVFGDQPDRETWLANVWERHAGRDGFRLALGYADAELVGFAYGYTGQRGQWWTDNVVAVWPDELAAQWLGGHFELVSIGVLTGARGRGVGRALIRALTEGLAHERWLLQATSDAHDPARRLYAAEGWEVVGPGVGEDRVVLGRRPVTAARSTSASPALSATSSRPT